MGQQELKDDNEIDNTQESGHLIRTTKNPSLDMWTCTHDEKRCTLEHIRNGYQGYKFEEREQLGEGFYSQSEGRHIGFKEDRLR